ncbi:MAG TPA: hypothetical protein VGM76_12070 [Lacipirellulaceae bacterium]|jgi:hypothetical protein
MDAIRIETLLEGDTLYLPELKPLVGKSVEIVVTELLQKGELQHGANWVSPLADSVLNYVEPFESAAVADWEANR